MTLKSAKGGGSEAHYTCPYSEIEVRLYRPKYDSPISVYLKVGGRWQFYHLYDNVDNARIGVKFYLEMGYLEAAEIARELISEGRAYVLLYHKWLPEKAPANYLLGTEWLEKKSLIYTLKPEGLHLSQKEIRQVSQRNKIPRKRKRKVYKK